MVGTKQTLLVCTSLLIFLLLHDVSIPYRRRRMPSLLRRQALALRTDQWPQHTDVPKRVWRTTHLSEYPNHVAAHAGGWQVEPVFNDKMCEEYLSEHFPPPVLAAFRRHKGAHKADLWRYAVLWREGGIYCDIKSIPLVHLDTILDRVKRAGKGKFAWYGVISDSRASMYNGIIMTPPHNPILRHLLDDACKDGIENECKRNYMRLCEEMGRSVVDEYSIEVYKGSCTATSENSALVLDEERCSRKGQCRLEGRVGGRKKDRYGTCCNAFAEDGTPVWQVRDPMYPWA